MKGLWIHHYELRQQSALNRVDLSTVRAGVLIRTAEGGIACLQPWEELGDPSLADSLADLRGAQKTPLVQQALNCAQLDGEARQRGESLFAGHSIPRSHATLPRLSAQALEEAQERGYLAVKIKRGKDWMALRRKTATLMERYETLRWRVDFNGALTSHRDLEAFLNSIPRERVDFIEDPFADLSVMASWRGAVPLAYDRDWQEADLPLIGRAQNGVLIGKPALHSRRVLRAAPSPLVVTSYMDHPVGQVYAAYEAAVLFAPLPPEKKPLCGLSTHGLYEKTPFSEELGEPAPDLLPPRGTGLGFDEILSTLPWKKG